MCGEQSLSPVVPASQTILSTSFLATLVPQCPLLGTVSPFILPPKPLGSSHPSLLAGLAKPGAASAPLRGCSLCLRCRSLLPGQLLSLFKSRIQFSPFLNPQLNTLGPLVGGSSLHSWQSAHPVLVSARHNCAQLFLDELCL